MHPLTDITNFPGTVNELERLLNFQLFHGQMSCTGGRIHLAGTLRKKEPLFEQLNLIIHYHNTTQHEFRQYGLARLAMLILDLQSIERNDGRLMKHFQRLFKRCTGNTYWGLRFEIDLAATLVKKALPFDKGEFLPGGDARNADFVLNPLAIECAGVHVDKLRFTTFLHKVQGVLVEKSLKPYCARTVALFIDITNLLHHRVLLELPFDEQGFRDSVRVLNHRTGFGSVVLSLWLFNKSTAEVRYQNLFIREDHPNIDPRLKKFLTEDFGLDGSGDPIYRLKPLGSY
jgi:hypothetical protein